MRSKWWWSLSLAAALSWPGIFPGPAAAHFHTFWPQVEGCYGKVAEPVTWRYFWGHPHEMIIYDAQAPKFFVHTPQGKQDPVSLKEISLTDQASGQSRRAFEVAYRPGAPGDYYLCLEGEPYFIPEEKVFWQDYVKEISHFMSQTVLDQPVCL